MFSLEGDLSGPNVRSKMRRRRGLYGGAPSYAVGLVLYSTF